MPADPLPRPSPTTAPAAARSPLEWLIWGGIALTIAAVTLAFLWSRIRPFETRVDLPLQYRLPGFTLTNQFGEPVTLEDFRGKVWVADIIFTRCAGPCPVMTRKLSEVQAALPRSSRARLVTLTTDPEYDTPAVLKRFGQRFDADFARWSFLTGRKDQITRLAVDGLKLIALPKDPAQRESDADLFIHSELFVVVDKRGNVRAAFESYQPDALEKVQAAVRQLERE